MVNERYRLFSTVVRSSECGSAFRFGKPDSCAVLIQIKAPETRVSPQELNLNFPCALSPLDTQEEAEEISNLENAQPAAIAPRRAF